MIIATDANRMHAEADINEILKILGLRRADAMSMLRLSDLMSEGLPLESLDRVRALVAPDDGRFLHLIVSEATLKRRRSRHQPLSPRESEKLERVARVWRLAKDVYQSDANARRFLNQPHPMLNDRPPLSVAVANDAGAQSVEGILGRLKYGSAA